MVVTMQHTSHGKPKLHKKCTLPLTGIKCVDRIITEMGVFDVTEDGLLLVEKSGDVTLDQIRQATEADFKVYLFPPSLIDLDLNDLQFFSLEERVVFEGSVFALSPSLSLVTPTSLSLPNTFCD